VSAPHFRRALPGAASLVVLLLAAAPAAAGQALDLLADGGLVPAPVADPRTPRFAVFQSWMRHDALPGTIATASFGGEVGLLRWTSPRGVALQLGAAGGMSAAFDMGARSNDLMNEDYVGGIPLALRGGRLGVRLMPYHVSSHLGDEFAERTSRSRSHVTYEALDVLLSVDVGGGRIYAGGTARSRGEPAALRPRGGQLGAELRRLACAACAPAGRLRATWIAALDARSGALRGAPVAWSGQAGIELSEPGSVASARRLALLLSAYGGPAPYHQFADHYVRGIGAGVVVHP
jgi:hypothetical protein